MKHKVHTRMYPEFRAPAGHVLQYVIYECGYKSDLLITLRQVAPGDVINPGDTPMGNDCLVCFPKTLK